MDDAFQDDFDDDDYVPPTEKQKTRFKKPKLSDIKVFKGKPVIRKIKVIKKIREDFDGSDRHSKSTSITCCEFCSFYVLLYNHIVLYNCDNKE